MRLREKVYIPDCYGPKPRFFLNKTAGNIVTLNGPHADLKDTRVLMVFFSKGDELDLEGTFFGN